MTMEALEQRICSRCHCRRPIEHFEGTTRCRRWRAARKADAERKRRAKYPGLYEPPPKTSNEAGEANEFFSHVEMSPSVNLATRMRHLLRRKMKPDELAERLVTLARSGDERIASSTLEMVLALQGVPVPKKVEESSDQRFFVISGNIVPKIDVEIPPSPHPSDKPDPAH